MKSIRFRLLITLLSLFTLSWMLLIVFTFLESRHEIEELFDAQLAQSAAVLSEITLESIRTNSPPRDLQNEIYGHRYEKKISFQLWEKDKLLFRSRNAPNHPMTTRNGYSDQMINGKLWRVFSLQVNDEYRIDTGERYDVRNELIHNITRDALYPLPLALPVLALLIWFGVSRALAPLNKIAYEVSKQSFQNLKPIESNNAVPKEIRPLVDALNNLLQRLNAAFERERNFTSDAAHELRTPLASIKTQSQVALRASNVKEQKQALLQIDAGVQRASHLVQQLLTLARLEPQAASGQLEPQNLSPIISDTLADMVQMAREKNIDLSFEEQQVCQIMGNTAALGILVRNLVDNSLRYTPDSGQVVISLSEDNGNAVLRVSDSGPGFAADEQYLVTQRFYRGANQQGSRGCGLGLSIVQRIVELHSANFTLQNQSLGNGAIVTVVFPCCKHQ